MQTEAALPSVTGDMQMSHEEFQRECELMLFDLQRDPSPPPMVAKITQLLLDAVRCSRDCRSLLESGACTQELFSELREGYHNETR